MNPHYWAVQVGEIQRIVGAAELTTPGYQAIADQVHMLMQQGGEPEQVAAMFRSLVPDIAECEDDNEVLIAACIFVALKDA